MPDEAVNYEIPSGVPMCVPDGGRWLLAYHDGNEESHVRHGRDGWFRLGATSGTWQVASSGNRPSGMTEAKPEEHGDA